MSLTHEDVQKILEILDQADCDEVEIEYGDLKLYLSRHGNTRAAQHPRVPVEDDAPAGSTPAAEPTAAVPPPVD
jgi:hypothetical protein